MCNILAKVGAPGADAPKGLPLERAMLAGAAIAKSARSADTQDIDKVAAGADAPKGLPLERAMLAGAAIAKSARSADTQDIDKVAAERDPPQRGYKKGAAIAAPSTSD